MSEPLAFTTRPLTAADEPFLWDMLYLAIHVPAGVAPPPRDIVRQPDLAKYVQAWGRAGDEGLIAIDQQTSHPIGAAWLRLFTADNPSYGYVADDIPELSMAVSPDYRGKGIGTRLLTELIAQKSSAMSLSVDPDNRVFELYKRIGFEVVGASGTSLTMLRSKTAN